MWIFPRYVALSKVLRGPNARTPVLRSLQPGERDAAQETVLNDLNIYQPPKCRMLRQTDTGSRVPHVPSLVHAMCSVDVSEHGLLPAPRLQPGRGRGTCLVAHSFLPLHPGEPCRKRKDHTSRLPDTHGVPLNPARQM